MKRCIINVACDKWYPKGQDRLSSGLELFGKNIDKLFWKNSLPPNSPDHTKAPYAFKAYALLNAYELGYETILWCDASIFPIKDVEPIYEYIEKNDYMFFANSYIGLFSTDICLDHFKIDRETAIGMREMMGCCFGLNLKSQKCKQFLDQCLEHALDGICFKGDWNNNLGQVSKDCRVLGHRHDQTVMSILAHNLNMNNFLIAHETFFAYKDQINHYFPKIGLPNSVSLLSEGM